MATLFRAVVVAVCLSLARDAAAIESLRAPPKEAVVYTYKTEYFHQRIDHFGFGNNDFYQQRYLINDTYWDAKESAPIFFYAGNEGDIEAFAQNSVRRVLDVDRK